MEHFDDLVAAYRILAQYGVIDAYGHVSIRSPSNPQRYLIARSLAPEVVQVEDVMEYDLDSNPLDARGRESVRERFIARPVFRHIARTRLREIFTAFALLLVLGIALLFETAGLSMALGAFLAGVLLAESEYSREIEAAIEPFKGLLLGLFFISVGMSVDFAVLLARPWLVVGIIVVLFILKGVVLWLIAERVRLPSSERPLFILLLAQGGEFAFVILGLAAANGAVAGPVAQAITLAVALSMIATPFLLVLYDRLIATRFADAAARPADTPRPAKVIVAGLGRVGQVVARLLNASGFQPTVLDDDPDAVEGLRKFGFRVFYGDATRLDLL